MCERKLHYWILKNRRSRNISDWLAVWLEKKINFSFTSYSTRSDDSTIFPRLSTEVNRWIPTEKHSSWFWTNSCGSRNTDFLTKKSILSLELCRILTYRLFHTYQSFKLFQTNEKRFCTCFSNSAQLRIEFENEWIKYWSVLHGNQYSVESSEKREKFVFLKMTWRK